MNGLWCLPEMGQYIFCKCQTTILELKSISPMNCLDCVPSSLSKCIKILIKKITFIACSKSMNTVSIKHPDLDKGKRCPKMLLLGPQRSHLHCRIAGTAKKSGLWGPVVYVQGSPLKQGVQ